METAGPDSSGTQYPEGEAQHLELLALSRVSAALSGLGDLDAILRVALDSVLDIMNGTIGGILLLDEQSQRLSYRVHQGLSTRYVKEMRLNLGDGIAGRVAKDKKSLLVNSIDSEERLNRIYEDCRFEVKSVLSVPLLVKDKVIGVVQTRSSLPTPRARQARWRALVALLTATAFCAPQ